MKEDQLWREDVASVADGDVHTWDGRPVHFRALVQRRWGWPKQAAFKAADFLLAEAAHRSERAVLHLTWEGRTVQQDDLFQRIPDLRQMLCTGMAQRAHRDIYHASDVVESITVRFAQPVTDDGLTRMIIHALATRFGCTTEELRGHYCPSCDETRTAREAVVSDGQQGKTAEFCHVCSSRLVHITHFFNEGTHVQIGVLASLFEP